MDDDPRNQFEPEPPLHDHMDGDCLHKGCYGKQGTCCPHCYANVEGLPRDDSGKIIEFWG